MYASQPAPDTLRVIIYGDGHAVVGLTTGDAENHGNPDGWVEDLADVIVFDPCGKVVQRLERYGLCPTAPRASTFGSLRVVSVTDGLDAIFARDDDGDLSEAGQFGHDYACDQVNRAGRDLNNALHAYRDAVERYDTFDAIWQFI